MLMFNLLGTRYTNSDFKTFTTKRLCEMPDCNATFKKWTEVFYLHAQI